MTALFVSLDHADEMPDLVDHAARLCGIRQFGDASDAIEAQADQRLPLIVMAADRAAGLHDLYGLVGRAHVSSCAGARLRYSDAASASPPSRRRDCSVDTLMLRRAATERGESW